MRILSFSKETLRGKILAMVPDDEFVYAEDYISMDKPRRNEVLQEVRDAINRGIDGL